MPLLKVIIGSASLGKVDAPVADWFVDLTREHGGFDVEVVDLADVALPFLDQPIHSRLRQYVHRYTKEWAASIERSDAFVIITPRYNYGYPASVKKALDHVYHEWAYAPVGFVYHGGTATNTRSLQQLRQVVTTLRMVPVSGTVNIPITTSLTQDAFYPPAQTIAAGKTMLDELARVEAVMHGVRRGMLITAS